MTFDGALNKLFSFQKKPPQGLPLSFPIMATILCLATWKEDPLESMDHFPQVFRLLLDLPFCYGVVTFFGIWCWPLLGTVINPKGKHDAKQYRMPTTMASPSQGLPLPFLNVQAPERGHD